MSQKENRGEYRNSVRPAQAKILSSIRVMGRPKETVSINVETGMHAHHVRFDDINRTPWSMGYLENHFRLFAWSISFRQPTTFVRP